MTRGESIQKMFEGFARTLDGIEGAATAPTSVDGVRGTLYEVQAYGAWIEVDHSTWRSWTGPRMANGAEHHGPVFVVDSPEGSPPYVGSRTCSCPTCQEHVAPEFRPN